MNPNVGSGYAPYDPATGKIHLAKTAERAEDVPHLDGCIVIPVEVTRRVEAPARLAFMSNFP